MSNPIPLSPYFSLSVSLWAGLTEEHRRQVIQLMARLLYQWVVSQPGTPVQEVTDVDKPQSSQSQKRAS